MPAGAVPDPWGSGQGLTDVYRPTPLGSATVTRRRSPTARPTPRADLPGSVAESVYQQSLGGPPPPHRRRLLPRRRSRPPFPPAAQAGSPLVSETLSEPGQLARSTMARQPPRGHARQRRRHACERPASSATPCPDAWLVLSMVVRQERRRKGRDGQMAARTRVPHLSVDERRARGKEARNP